MSQQVYDFREIVFSNVMWQIVSGYTKPPHTEVARPFATRTGHRTVVTPFGSVLNESVWPPPGLWQSPKAYRRAIDTLRSRSYNAALYGLDIG